MKKIIFVILIFFLWVSLFAEKGEKMELLRLFPRIAMIGDSLSSGEIVEDDDRALGVLFGGVHPERGVVDQGPACVDKTESSWCSHITRRINAKCVHYTRGGITAKGWLETYNYFMALEKEKYPLYFIALGANDFNGYKLGDPSDTLKDNTFLGYYNEIIKSIKIINPHAVVLCLSMYYDEDETRVNSFGNKDIDFTNGVKKLTENYEKVYFLDFAHEGKNVLNKTEYIRRGHYDSVGYLAVSYEIEAIANKVLAEHVNDLKDITLYM